MFCGQAPPFGWYWSASRSRDSAPSVERDLRHLAGRAGMVRRELASLLGLAVAAAAGGEDDRRRADLDLVAGLGRQRRAPAVLACSSAVSGWLRKRRAVGGLERLAQRLRDRVAGAVADLQQALARRAAAAREPVAAVLARELDAALLEPVDRAGRLARQDLDEPPVGGLVRALPDVLGVLLRRVVVAERGLDPALRLRRVAGLQRALGGEATRAPARSAETAAARPEAPLPITSTSKGPRGRHEPRNSTLIQRIS